MHCNDIFIKSRLSSSAYHVEIYTQRECPSRELAHVLDTLKGHLTEGHFTVNDINRFTKDEKTELKRCAVQCGSLEEAVKLAEKLRHMEKIESVFIVEPRQEGVDATCTIL